MAPQTEHETGSAPTLILWTVNPTSRRSLRMRGYPAQYFLTAVLITAANLRKAQRFLAMYENPNEYRRGKARPSTVVQALPKRPVKAACVDAYARHHPGAVDTELAADGLTRHRALANERYQRAGRLLTLVTDQAQAA